MYPVTVPILTSIFKNYGPVLKVLICTRNNGIQSFVEVQDLEKAKKAFKELDGKNIYSGCNQLKIQYSTMEKLEIKHNSDLSQDFTQEKPHASEIFGPNTPEPKMQQQLEIIKKRRQKRDGGKFSDAGQSDFSMSDATNSTMSRRERAKKNRWVEKMELNLEVTSIVIGES